MVPVDVLCPRRKPGHGVIMDDLFPLAGDIRNWNSCVGCDVDGDILGLNT
jgi:hypothetical protein